MFVVITILATLPGVTSNELPQSFSCPDGYFQCGNVTECVHQKYFCDGKADCFDGFDEIPTKCRDNFGWANLISRITTFDKSNNDTLQPRNFIRRCELDDYPEACECTFTSVSCANANLTGIPTNISGSVTHLYVSGNKIKRLEPGIFKEYPNLLTLSLFDNAVEKLEEDTFQGLPRLEKLYLNDNKIKEIEDGAFRSLQKLAWLMLNNNHLKSLGEGMFEGLESVYYLNLKDNEVTEADFGTQTFTHMPSLEWLNLGDNYIKHLHTGMFPNNSALKVLFLGSNLIQSIHEDTFRGLDTLEDLDLSDNLLSTIPAKTFHELISLAKLNLCNNRKLRRLPLELFSNLHQLRTLNLTGVKITNIDTKMFNSMQKLEHLYFAKFHYCSYASHVRDCSPKSDGISSLENLLANKVLRCFIWIVAATTLVCNLAVILGRMCIMKIENKVHSLLIKNLCGADLLMGIYLVIIGSHDLMYRNHYYIYSHKWMTSWTCSLCGFLAVFSSETTLLVLTVISVQRFLCIAFQTRMIHFKYSYGVISIAAAWITAAALAAFPLTMSSFNHFYGKNGACFPLLDPNDPFEAGWQYSVAMFLGLNAVCFCLIVCSYVGMFYSIRETRNAAFKDINLRRRGDMNFAKRFVFIVLSNALCLVPIMLITAMVFTDIGVPGQVYAWTTVFVVPINSASDPLLYTLTTVPCKQGCLGMLDKKLKRQKESGTRKMLVSSTTGSRSSRDSSGTTRLTSSGSSGSPSQDTKPCIEMDTAQPLVQNSSVGQIQSGQSCA
ncbi:relaxin receptor 2-like [Ptychodera flava]|uniref:relaxin receptor 2-like n=1 Tax=Ptychodera flava TaxID=63121 RepID=UPI00396A6888